MKALVWRGPPVGACDDGVTLLDWQHGQPEDRYGVEWAIRGYPPPPGAGHWLADLARRGSPVWRRLTDAEAVAVCRGERVWVETFNMGSIGPTDEPVGL